MNLTIRNFLNYLFLFVCYIVLGVSSITAKTPDEAKSVAYRRTNGTMGSATCIDSIKGWNWSLYIAYDEVSNKKGLIAKLQDSLFIYLPIKYTEVEFTSLMRYCWVKDRYDCFLYDITSHKKHKIRRDQIENYITGKSHDHGKFFSDGEMILFEDGHIISAPYYDYKIKRHSKDTISVLTGSHVYDIDDSMVSSAWRVNSFASLEDSIVGDYFIQGFVNDSVIIAFSPDGRDKALIQIQEEAFDTLNLSCYSKIHTILNTEKYLLCEEHDSLLYILDYEKKQRHLLNTANLPVSTNEQPAYLGERKNEPLFLLERNWILGLHGFSSHIDYRLEIDTQRSRNANKIFIKDSKSVGVWVCLDELMSDKELSSIFDSRNLLEEDFILYKPDTAEYGHQESEFICVIPRLQYKAELKRHILFWISECISLCGGYEMLVPSQRTKVQDILEHYRRQFIRKFSYGNVDFWGGYESFGVERILDTKEYVSFVLDNSNHLGGGTGYGSSYATTFDKKTNRRLNLDDIIMPEALPVIEDYLRKISEREGCTYCDSMIHTSVALGSDGLNFIYGRYTLGGGWIERYIVPYYKIEKWLKISFQDFEDNIPSRRLLLFANYPQDWNEDIDSDVPRYELADKLLSETPQKKHSNPLRDSQIAKQINGGYNTLNLLNIVDSNPSKAIDICEWLMTEEGALGGYKLNYSGIIMLAKIALSKDAILKNEIGTAKKYLNEVIQESESYTTSLGYDTHIDAYRLLSDIAVQEDSLSLLVAYQDSLSGLLKKHVQDVFVSSTRDIRNGLWEKYKKWFFSEVQSAAYRTKVPRILESAYNALLLSKGLLLNTEIALKKHILNGNNDELKENYTRVETLRHELKIAERYKKDVKEIEKLEEQLSDAESALMNEVAYSNYSHLQNIQMHQILKNLHPGEIAIEFVDVEEDGGTVYYALMVKRGDICPQMKRLFTEKMLQSLSVEDYANGKLYDLVWNPLEDNLDSITTIFFSPSGKLYTIPIEYAIKPKIRECLYDLYDIHRLSSTREIVQARDSIFKENPSKGTCLLIGGLDYDAVWNNDISLPHEDVPSSLLRSVMSHQLKIRLLPGTKEEILGIVPYAKQLTTMDSIMILTDSKGTEMQFKQSINAPISNLHIATHGFYLTDKEFSKLNDKDFFSFLGQDLRDIDEKRLVRSGLVFAGVNQFLRGKIKHGDMDDGLLTTLEIGTLDLNSIDLVVLSACDSGEGDISSEGVYGLQRGFKKAGVSSILMSLWKVDDDATKLLMIKFYESLLTTKDKHLALRTAQRYLRDYSNGKYSHPTYWAAFVLLDGFDSDGAVF